MSVAILAQAISAQAILAQALLAQLADALLHTMCCKMAAQSPNSCLVAILWCCLGITAGWVVDALRN